MADGNAQQDKDFFLEDDEEGYLAPSTGQSSGLRMSATTDTLDSVILETSPDDNPVKQDTNILSLDGRTEQVDQSDLLDEKTECSYPVGISIEAVKEIDENVDQSEVSNLSSYFGVADSGDNFFDSIGSAGSKNDGKLGNDIFTSISISKSEEDIRLSEMNAREIKESDVISESNKSLDADDLPNLSRNQSFQDVADSISIENLALKDDEVIKGTEFDQVKEVEEEDIIHIHHREHKSSTSEPEPIAFEGEADNLHSGQDGSGNLKDLAEKKEFEEIMAQAEDIIQPPEYTTQLSSTSDKSESPRHSATGPFNNMPSLASSTSLPSSSESKLHPTGPFVGTTPSQMSPIGTPVHQTSHDGTGSAKTTDFANPPGFHTQTSVPGSPFHSPLSQDIGSSGGGNASVFAPFGTSSNTDDAFTSILSMSDSDRRHDAWIPSDATSHILFTMATNPPGTFTPAQEQLSTPGIINNERQGDPVRDLVLRYMGEQEAIKRSVLTVDSVTQDVGGLKKLIEAGCLRAAIDLTGRLLEQVGQGDGKANSATVHTPHSLQLWFVRLTLMVKLRMFEQAEAEIRPFQTLDTPDLYFQFYPNTYPGRRGSMVSFSMRLLHAELPLLCGRSQESLDRLYYMMAVCTRIKSNLSSDLNEDGSATHMTYEARKVSLELWNQRELQILYKIAATMLSVKDYEGALSIYKSLLEREKNAQLELKAGIGRIHLQMGNINEASQIIKEVETESTKGDSPMPCFNLLNKGLVAMCSNNFHDAYQHFKSAVQIQPHNTCAVNNMAVCSLYLGRLKDALNTLEQLVHSDPANTLHEGVLFNLCTLYELETSRALHKKQAILDLVNKHKGDGFPVACLKMA